MAQVQPHTALRGTCKHCTGMHSSEQHKSHGRGSFARTHGGDMAKPFEVTVKVAGGLEQSFPIEAPTEAVAGQRAHQMFPNLPITGVKPAHHHKGAFPKVVEVSGILCVMPAVELKRSALQATAMEASKAKPAKAKPTKAEKRAKKRAVKKATKVKKVAEKSAKKAETTAKKAEKVAKGEEKKAKKAKNVAKVEDKKVAEAKEEVKAKKAKPAATPKAKAAKKRSVRAATKKAKEEQAKAKKAAQDAKAEAAKAAQAKAEADKAKAEAAEKEREAAAAAAKLVQAKKAPAGAPTPSSAKAPRSRNPASKKSSTHTPAQKPARAGASRAQSILFLKSKWTPATAEEWLKGHKKRADMMQPDSEKSRYWHFRQFEPTPGLKHAMQPFGEVKHGIKAVLEINPRAKRAPPGASGAPSSGSRARSSRKPSERKPNKGSAPRVPSAAVDDTVVFAEIEKRYDDPNDIADLKAVWRDGGRENTLAWMQGRKFGSTVEAFESWIENHPAIARAALEPKAA